MSIESHGMRDCNITANIGVITYYFSCVVNLLESLFVVQNGLSRNYLIELHLFKENSNVDFRAQRDS